MDGSLEKRLGDLYWSNADIISESAPVLNAPRADALVAFNLTGVPARGSAGGDRYHYTGLREAFGAEYESYFTPSYASASVRHLDLEGGRAGFMNGFHSGAEPLTETPEGVLYGSLAAAAFMCRAAFGSPVRCWSRSLITARTRLCAALPEVCSYSSGIARPSS